MAEKSKHRKTKATSATSSANGDVAETTDAPPAHDPGNLDKIRTILFGTQIREFEKKFSRLESRLEREIEAIRENMRRRFDELEAYVKEENDALNKRLSNELQLRKKSEEEAARERQALAEASRTALAELDARHSEAERALRERLLGQSKELSEEIERRIQTLSAMVRDAVDTLQDEKTDRRALADLFEEFSTRLRDDFKLPFDE
ncbi:hypothetical protein [Rhodocaloribacter sp.]